MNLFASIATFVMHMVIYSANALNPPKEMVQLLGSLAQGWLIMVWGMVKLLLLEKEMFKLMLQVKGKLK